MNEKLVKLSDVEFYLRRTAKNMIDEAEKDTDSLTEGEREQIAACVLALRELANNAHRLPAVDAVEVVRCKECREWKNGLCKMLCADTQGDGYCYWGAKMDGGGRDAAD